MEINDSKKTIIFHNPRCSKSREALTILQNLVPSFETYKYLEEKLSFSDLKSVIELLGIKPTDLIRKKEEVFIKQFADKDLSDEEWIEVLLSNPKLIERPIVIHQGKAIIGRPPQKIIEIL